MAKVKCICTGCGITHNIDSADIGKAGYPERGFLSAGCSRCAGLIKRLKGFDKWGVRHPECLELDCGTCFKKSCKEMGLYL